MGALAVDQLGINGTADETNRLVVSAPASLFNHDGSSHRLVVNKNDADDTASLVFQNGYSGRAEFGISGSDNLALKVSPDGDNWLEALACDRNTAEVRATAGLSAPGLPIRIASAVLTTGFFDD